tara:strand:+ start:2756 stop:2998 length:243 start_codon:yes stop_codon:yes gene_type:complete
VRNKFKLGDLICLNNYGFLITPDAKGIVGIIISDAYSIVAPVESENNSFYTVYDILFNGELFKMVPEEFLERYEKNEKDP